MKKTMTNTMGALAIASLALSLTACSSPEETNTTSSNEPSTASNGEDCLNSWDELRAGIKAPENADKVGGDESAIAATTKGLEAAQAFYTDTTPAGTDADDVERTPEDFALLRDYLSASQAEMYIDYMLPDLISAEDFSDHYYIYSIFPQARFAKSLTWDVNNAPLKVLDVANPSDVSYCFQSFSAEVKPADTNPDVNNLVTELVTEVTRNGTLDGDKSALTTKHTLQFVMEQSADGSWVIQQMKVPPHVVLDY